MGSDLGPSFHPKFDKIWDPIRAHFSSHGWSKIGADVGQNVHLKFDQKWDPVLFHMPTQAWSKNGTPFWPTSWATSKNKLGPPMFLTICEMRWSHPDKTATHIQQTMGSKFSPNFHPVFDQTLDENLDQRRIPFLIKLGMRIWTQIRYNLDQSWDKNLGHNRIPFLISVWWKFEPTSRWVVYLILYKTLGVLSGSI